MVTGKMKGLKTKTPRRMRARKKSPRTRTGRKTEMMRAVPIFRPRPSRSLPQRRPTTRMRTRLLLLVVTRKTDGS
jgi:hypothetical protein